jgi:hypothetical protein
MKLGITIGEVTLHLDPQGPGQAGTRDGGGK